MLKKIVPYFFILGLFFVDICSTAFFEEPVIYALTAFYCACLFRKSSLPVASVTLFFLGLESFFYYGRFGINLFILLPLSLIILRYKKSMDIPRLGPPLALLIYLILSWGMLEYLVLGLHGIDRYTLVKISANLALVTIFS